MYKELFISLYLYIILMFTLITLSFLCSPYFDVSCKLNPGIVYLKWDLSFISFSQIKIAYFYLMFNILLKTVCRRKKWAKNVIFTFSKCTRHVRILSNLILWLFGLNFILIGIVNFHV